MLRKMMLKINKVLVAVLVLGLVIPLSGCTSESKQKAMAFQNHIIPIEDVQLPNKKIIAIGEATHGNKEFTVVRQQLFSNFVENGHGLVFAIEGDFGGGQKVNDYILEGIGTAEEAVKEIGFTIYKTEEMVQLVNWMYEYNNTAPEEKKIHFYGFDMQRYDNNKEYLYTYLQKAVGEESAQNSISRLADLTDATMYDEAPVKIQAGQNEIQEIIAEMEAQKEAYINRTSKEEYDLALAFATCIEQNTNMCLNMTNANDIRDTYMAEKVEWILQYENEYYSNDTIFLAAHNGHVEKSSTSLGYTCMGNRLADKYEEDYYAIGTEFYKGSFLAIDSSDDVRKEFSLENDGEDRFALLFADTDLDEGYLTLQDLREDEGLSDLLSTPQPMTNIGAVFHDSYKQMKRFYTLNMTPEKAYDAMAFYREVTPSTMLPEE